MILTSVPTTPVTAKGSNARTTLSEKESNTSTSEYHSQHAFSLQLGMDQLAVLNDRMNKLLLVVGRDENQV